MSEQLQEKLKKVKAEIISNSKDAHFAQSLIDELMNLQSQASVETTEIYIRSADIVKAHDFGPTKLSKLRNGKFLFEAKGGLHTVVDMRMMPLYTTCSHIFDYIDNPSEDNDVDEMEQALRDATIYAFQAPILCSLDQGILYDVIAAMVRSFRERAERIIANASSSVKPETEADVESNIAFEHFSSAIETITDASINDNE